MGPPAAPPGRDHAARSCSWTRLLPHVPRSPASWCSGRLGDHHTSGKPAFIGLAPGTGESTPTPGHAFLTELQDWGRASLSRHHLPTARRADLGPSSRPTPGPVGNTRYPPGEEHPGDLAGTQAEVKDETYWKIFDTADLKTQLGPRLVESIDAPDQRDGEKA